MSEPGPRFEVPPEYADVYEKAFRSASHGDRDDGDEGAGGGGAPGGPWWRRHAWSLAAALLLVLVIAVGAYALGRADGHRRPSSTPARTTTSAPATGSGISPLTPQLATSTCRPPTVSDAGGKTVSFVPGNALDRDTSTSWACSGTATGEELDLTLPEGSIVTRVGLMPTGSVSGVTLNRIDAVDWIFADGATVHQDLTGDTQSVAQIIDVPPASGRAVRLRLSAVTPGPADLTAVASVYLWGPRRG
ncbi:hypothetical protein GCM10011519_17080 [Marmoricola endophyticus]|uniref:Discoidin domain-containing protein n=1 Tax=Marmoricola endophyticus TaxID=2040280 RepID=A0A917BKD1_9ACTN|nr:hypothetical protein [Marmoricola endophyticus]GGF43798.1 hypothetical protein GCM10011519_17080 [Marmoricola endophyticus]